MDKTEEWAPRFHGIGFEAVCRHYEESWQEVIRASGSVKNCNTCFTLDFVEVGPTGPSDGPSAGPSGGPSGYICVKMSLDDDYENGANHCIEFHVESSRDDWFDVVYDRQTHRFDISALEAKRRVPPSVWEALVKILPLVANLDGDYDDIARDVHAWLTKNDDAWLTKRDDGGW